ncbi:hypothetical protein BB558_001952 [Smittium angustum]|uniref:alanine--glyoxylate transaminase n=1 Tax=Smittium angustum TaxID=133377 RepID=A0A2U1JA12_SMIAN|nr:hypothetical protein BB558_001952 [Smittium angustum]
MSSQKPLCMMPGPTECSDDVIQMMSTKATSHTDPHFAACFRELLKNLKIVFGTSTGQPFVITGSGTLGWDQTCANLLEQGENVLLLSTGFFGNGFGDCMKAYGANVDKISAKIGETYDMEKVEAALKSKHYKIVAAIHVDTSSGVVVDVEALCKLIQRISPSTLVVFDSVCAAAAERLYFDRWGVDVVIAASQKALGCPPGVSIVMVSQKALETVNNRKTPIHAYYVSWKRWLPVMIAFEHKKPAYFTTPCVQTIMALNLSVRHLVELGMEEVFKRHKETGDKFVKAIRSIGLVPLAVSDNVRTSAMTAVWLPQGIALPDLLSKMLSRGITISGGLFQGHATEYFRVGHMGVSATDPSLDYVDRTIAALNDSLIEAGYNHKSRL